MAGGLAVGEQNAVAAGTGGASTARTDDVGAAWYDPAALADGGGWRVGLSLNVAHPTLEARGTDPASPWSASTRAAWLTPPHLDVAIAVDRWVAGVAVGVPFGGGVAWPDAWPGADVALRSELQVFRVAPFFGWSFGAFKLAAGPHLDAGRLQLERGLDFIDTQGDVKLDLDGRGAGVDVAAHYTVDPHLAFGAAFKSRTTLHLRGGANFTAPAAFSEKTPDQAASTTMILPDTLTVGGAYARGAWRALADVAWTRWSVNRDTTIAFTDPNTPSAVQQDAWHDTVAVRAGVEWTRDRLVARAGGYVDPSPVPTAHLAPTTPDSTRFGATVGASYRVATAWTADAYGEVMVLARRVSTDADAMIPASYGGHALVLGVGLRWTPGQAREAPVGAARVATARASATVTPM